MFSRCVQNLSWMPSGCSFWPLGPPYELPLGAHRAKRAPKSLHFETLFSNFFWSSSVLDARQGRTGAQGVPEGHFGFIWGAFWDFFWYISDSWDASRPLQNHFPMDVWMLCCTTSKHIKIQTNWAKSMHKNFKGPSKSPEHPKCRNTSRCGGVASAFSIITLQALGPTLDE